MLAISPLVVWFSCYYEGEGRGSEAHISSSSAEGFCCRRETLWALFKVGPGN